MAKFDIIARLKLGVKGFIGGLSRAKRGVISFSRFATSSFAGIGRSLSRIAGFGGLGIGIGAAVAGIATIKKGIQEAGSFEQLRVSYAGFVGDVAKSRRLLDSLIDFSNVTSLTGNEVAQAGRLLLSANQPLEEIPMIIRDIGNASAATGANFIELVRAYQRNIENSVLLTRDLNEFANRGIPIWQEIAKQQGVSVARLREIVENGELGPEALSKGLRSLSSEGGRFFNVLQNQTQTFNGQLTVALSKLQAFFRAFGKPIIDALFGPLQSLNDDVFPKLLAKAGEWGRRIAGGFDIINDALKESDTNVFKIIDGLVEAAVSVARLIAAVIRLNHQLRVATREITNGIDFSLGNVLRSVTTIIGVIGDLFSRGQIGDVIANGLIGAVKKFVRFTVGKFLGLGGLLQEALSQALELNFDGDKILEAFNKASKAANDIGFLDPTENFKKASKILENSLNRVQADQQKKEAAGQKRRDQEALRTLGLELKAAENGSIANGKQRIEDAKEEAKIRNAGQGFLRSDRNIGANDPIGLALQTPQEALQRAAMQQLQEMKEQTRIQNEQLKAMENLNDLVEDIKPESVVTVNVDKQGNAIVK